MLSNLSTVLMTLFVNLVSSHHWLSQYIISSFLGSSEYSTSSAAVTSLCYCTPALLAIVLRWWGHNSRCRVVAGVSSLLSCASQWSASCDFTSLQAPSISHVTFCAWSAKHFVGVSSSRALLSVEMTLVDSLMIACTCICWMHLSVIKHLSVFSS